MAEDNFITMGRESARCVTPIYIHLMITPRVRDWLRAMNAEDSRRIALRNLKFDLGSRRVRRSLLKAFLAYIEQHWREQAPRPVAEAMIKRFTRENTPPPRTCQGKPRPDDVHQCSRVMEARSCWYFHIRPAAAGTTLEDDVTDDEIERTAIYGVGPAAHGELKSEVPFAWITQTAAINKLRQQHHADGIIFSATFAAALRDALGLYHFIRTEKLVEVVYPEYITRNFVVAPPTFLEGSDLVFRSGDGGAGWGRTVPLNGMQDMPEAVHEPIPFSEHFKIRPVGSLARTSVAFTWRELAGEPTILEELEEAIERFLSEEDGSDE